MCSKEGFLLTRTNRRRYVIRVRAETDQFLLSCIELENFVRWLEALFAAIDIAAPIEDRDFPRDQSIPREQRRRQQRQQQRQRPPDASADAHDGPTTTAAGLINAIMEAGTPPTRYAPFGIPAPPPLSSSERPSMAQPPVRTRTAPLGTLSETSSSSSSSSSPSPSPSSSSHAPSQILDIDPTTGKWAWSPSHVWTARHDLLYARLCYAVLLYRSPRKSDLVVRGDRGGTLWRVNWQTGSMVRALPPAYGETLGGRK